MALANPWVIFRDSARAAEPYYGRLVAHYVLVLLCPALVIFFFVGFLIPIAVLIDYLLLLERLHHDRNKSFTFILISSPFVTLPCLSLAFGLAGYLSGTAQPQHYNLIGVETLGYIPIDLYNLEPVTRRPMSTSFLAAVPLGYLAVAPYNAVLYDLSRQFGPMRGAYRGPYPDAEAAQNWLNGHGISWKREQMLEPGWRMQDVPPTITGARILALMDDLPERSRGFWKACKKDVRLALFSPECLLVEYETVLKEQLILVLDTGTQSVIARYRKPSDKSGG